MTSVILAFTLVPLSLGAQSTRSAPSREPATPVAFVLIQGPGRVGSATPAQVPAPTPATPVREPQTPKAHRVAHPRPVAEGTLVFDDVIPAKTITVGDETIMLPPIGLIAQSDSTGDDPKYLEAQAAMRRGEFRRAATLFGEYERRRRGTTYAPRALYFQAFSYYRIGDVASMRSSLAVLNDLTKRYPRSSSVGDARILQTRVCGELAQRGDRECMARIAKDAEVAASGKGCEDGDPNIELQVIALNALTRMEAAEALPLLKKVMARRDECSNRLRRQAVTIIGQLSSPVLMPLVIDVVRKDPDPAVRNQMAQWFVQNVRRASLTPVELVKLYDDVDNRDVQSTLLGMFMRDSSDVTIGKVVSIAKDLKDPLRSSAVSYLSQTRDPRVVRALIRVLE